MLEIIEDASELDDLLKMSDAEFFQKLRQKEDLSETSLKFNKTNLGKIKNKHFN